MIELVVVIGVVSLVLPAIFAIIFNIVNEQTKLVRLITVKTEGDNVLNVVANNIRNNAVGIYSSQTMNDSTSVCGTTGSSASSPLYFQDSSGQWFEFQYASSTISSLSATLSLPLNSSKTQINNFTLSCSRSNSYSPPIVNLSFSICYNVTTGSCTSARPEETALMDYQTSISLRNFSY